MRTMVACIHYIQHLKLSWHRHVTSRLVSIPFSHLTPNDQRLSKSLLSSLPVQHIPDSLEVFSLAVLVLKVISVLPSINTQDWSELASDWVLVGVVLDRELASLGVLDQPGPSGSLKTSERGVESALELVEGAVGLGESSLRSMLVSIVADRERGTVP